MDLGKAARCCVTVVVLLAVFAVTVWYFDGFPWPFGETEDVEVVEIIEVEEDG
jgi:hypothetical protein